MTNIKKIHLRGFKSFAKPIDLDFGSGFNCVLGPNGSGKSNIMDALCFVLGELSAKSMRAEKSANLIFNGGKKGNPLQEAEVSIFFRNDNNEFKIGGDELKLTRSIKQNGTSTYRINDEVRTRQQILELLATAHINPDGHNIILQGDIIRFVDMKPNEMRELIEDISGIGVFEERKAKALNEFTKVDEKMNEASIILNERDAYLRELKKDRDQAMKYKELEKNIKSNKATYLHYQVKDHQEKKDAVEKRIQNQNDAVQHTEHKITELKQKIQNKKDELKTVEQDIETKGEKEAVMLHKDIETLKTDIVRNTERFNTVANEISRVEERKKQMYTTIQDTQHTIKGLETNTKELHVKLQQLTTQEQKQAALVKTLREQIGLGEHSELDALEQKLDVAEKSFAHTQEKHRDILHKKFSIDAKIASLQDKLKGFTALDKEMNIDKTRKDIEKFDKEHATLQAEEDSLYTQLESISDNILRKNRELFQLRAKESGIKESVFEDHAVKKIINLHKQGVYGTVNQLGTVDPRYSLALEVAAGTRMKNIVVADDKIAADCITLLKQEKIGIATFLPLNKIKGKQTPSLTGKGIHGSALDLIQFEPPFKNIFSFLFGGTIVVDDIATARNVGIGKMRMVTLDGDLVELSGAMVGGYRMKRPGLSFQEKDVSGSKEKIEKELVELEKKQTIIQKRREEIKKKLYELLKVKNTSEGELIKIETTTGGLSIKQLKQDIETLHKDTIYQTFFTAEKELITLQKEVSKLRKEKETLRKQYTSGEANTQELEKHEHKHQNTRTEIVQIETDLKNITLQIQNIYNPELTKTQEIIKEHDKETSSFIKEKEHLHTLLKQQQTSLKESEKKEQAFQQAYKNLFTQRNKLTEEIQKSEAAITIEEAKIKDMNNKMNEISIVKAKINAELDVLEKEFDEYKGTPLRKNIDHDKLKEEIKHFEQLMIQMGNVNLRALEVYENIKKEYEAILEKVAKLKEEKEQVIQMMYEIEKKKKGTFMKTFTVINKNLTTVFNSLSTKGEASLVLENKEDPLQGGVEIQVKIIGNKHLDIKSLSGGEKTIAALALIFAIQEHQPESFYLLDEVDAALDKTNSQLLSKLIKQYSQTAQYILISHNDSVISEADQIYGVSMQENGVSKVISLKI